MIEKLPTPLNGEDTLIVFLLIIEKINELVEAVNVQVSSNPPK